MNIINFTQYTPYINNKNNRNNLSFKAYERSFMIIKPDAFEKKLEKVIEKNIIDKGLKITESFEGIAPRVKMENNYIAKKHKSFFKEWMDFLTSGKLKAIVVEGDDAITKALDIKSEIRRLYAPNEKRYNLVHCSDDTTNATREIINFFGWLNLLKSNIWKY